MFGVWSFLEICFKVLIWFVMVWINWFCCRQCSFGRFVVRFNFGDVWAEFEDYGVINLWRLLFSYWSWEKFFTKSCIFSDFLSGWYVRWCSWWMMAWNFICAGFLWGFIWGTKQVWGDWKSQHLWQFGWPHGIVFYYHTVDEASFKSLNRRS